MAHQERRRPRLRELELAALMEGQKRVELELVSECATGIPKTAIVWGFGDVRLEAYRKIVNVSSVDLPDETISH